MGWRTGYGYNGAWSMAVKALDTHYNGYEFRSRLEARWAVFFDTAGIDYHYESEAFDLGDGQQYLPDFFLKRGIRFLGEERPRQDVWVDIESSAQLIDDERQKVTSFVRQTGKSILLIAGDPGNKADVLYLRRLEDDTLDAADVAFMELADGQAGLVAEREKAKLERSEDRALIEQRMQTDLLREAYRAARVTRFDRKLKRCKGCGREFQPEHNRYNLCYTCQNRRNASNGQKAATNRPLPRNWKSELERFLAGFSPEQRRIALFFVIVAVLGLITWSACQATSFPSAMLGLIGGNVQPTETPGLPATYTPVPTPAVRMEGLVPGMVTRSICSCTADLYECADFADQDEAQACFDFCQRFVGDVHQLDDDGDGRVCVSEP